VHVLLGLWTGSPVPSQPRLGSELSQGFVAFLRLHSQRVAVLGEEAARESVCPGGEPGVTVRDTEVVGWCVPARGSLICGGGQAGLNFPGHVRGSRGWMCYLAHGEGAAVTHGEDTVDHILWVWQGCGPMQALAQRDGKLWRFARLGGQRVVLEQRAWRGRRGKGIPPALVRF